MSVFGVILVRTFTAFSRNAGKCGKNAGKNNCEYEHFLRSVKVRSSHRKLINMLFSWENTGWNFLQIEKTMLPEKELHVSSTSTIFQRKYEDFN